MTNFKRKLAVTVAAAGFVFAATAAQAIPSISIVWQNTGSATIGTPTVTASSVINADIVLTGDSSGVAVNGVFISILFDTTELLAIGGQELSTVKLPGMANTMSPIGAGTTVDNVNGVILGFDQATLDAGLGTAVSRTLGSVRFHVIGAVGDGQDDVIGAVLPNGVDAITAVGNSVPIEGAFVGASVTATPEPTTALLVIAGLAGLGYAGRRSLR